MFGTRQQISKIGEINIRHGNDNLERVHSYKYLGVKLDPNLNFSTHCEYVRSKAFGKIRTLGQTRQFLDTNTSLMLYKTLVLPIFEYADFIYDYLSKKDSMMIERLQSTSLQCIMGYDRLDSATQMRTELHQ